MNNNNYFEIDYKSKTLNRSRTTSGVEEFNFLINRSQSQIIEKIKNFNNNLDFILEIGCQGSLGNSIYKNLAPNQQLTVDMSLSRLNYNDRSSIKLVLIEDNLPFKSNSFSGIISCLYIDNSSNSIDFFTQVFNILSENGFLIISLFGSNTLDSIKKSFIKIEEKKYNGASLRFHPLFELQTIGDQLKKIGFKNVIVETETISIKYKTIFKLMHDLRGMGLTNSLKNRSKFFTPKSFFVDIDKHLLSNKTQNFFLANFEVITVTAWKS